MLPDWLVNRFQKNTQEQVVKGYDIFDSIYIIEYGRTQRYTELFDTQVNKNVQQR